jgi:hypothetical protein
MITSLGQDPCLPGKQSAHAVNDHGIFDTHVIMVLHFPVYFAALTGGFLLYSSDRKAQSRADSNCGSCQLCFFPYLLQSPDVLSVAFWCVIALRYWALQSLVSLSARLLLSLSFHLVLRIRASCASHSITPRPNRHLSDRRKFWISP